MTGGLSRNLYLIPEGRWGGRGDEEGRQIESERGSPDPHLRVLMGALQTKPYGCEHGLCNHTLLSLGLIAMQSGPSLSKSHRSMEGRVSQSGDVHL